MDVQRRVLINTLDIVCTVDLDSILRQIVLAHARQ